MIELAEISYKMLICLKFLKVLEGIWSCMEKKIIKKKKVQSSDLLLLQANCRKWECKFCNLWILACIVSQGERKLRLCKTQAICLCWEKCGQ